MSMRRLVSVVSGIAVVSAALALSASAQPERQPSSPAPAGQPGGDRPQRGPGGPDNQRQASLEGSMKGMNRALKQLNGQLGDKTKKEENLKLLGNAERSCVAAKEAPLPEKVTRDAKDEAAKAVTAAKVRKSLMQSLRLMLDIEQSVMEEKTEAAKAKLEELIKLRDASHKELGVKDED